MSIQRRTTRRLAVLAGLGLAGAAGACSTVSPEEMDTGLQSLREEMRQEMQQGDQQVRQQLGDRIDSIEERVAQLESDLQEMEQEFQVTVQRLEEQLRFDVPVYFGFDEAELGQDAAPVLDRFAAVAMDYYPEAMITVEGFTDPAGSAEYNRQLGQRRADAVRGYLVDQTHMNGDMIRSVSYGEDSSRLIAPSEAGPDSGWQNRRVVLVIDHHGAPPMTSTTDEQGSER